MKKGLVFFTLLIFNFNLFGQIGSVETIAEKIHVGYNNNMTKFHSLSYSLDNEGNKIYTLRYRNMEYQSIDTYDLLIFKATDTELEFLHNFLKEGMNYDNGKTLEIGNHKIFVIKKGKAVRISDITEFKEKNYFWLLPKELDRLFGKRK